MHAIAGGSGRAISATRASLVTVLLLLGAALTVATPVGVRAASVPFGTDS